MKYQYDGYNWLVRLDKGERLVESLNSLIKSEKITGAWLSGLGSCSHAEVGYYDLATKQYVFKELNKPMEILSLQGNVGISGDELSIHIHAMLADESLGVVGGHLKELTVSGTCEIFLHKWWGKPGISRQFDETTDLKLLDL